MKDQDSPWLSFDVDSLHRVTDPDQAAVIADPARSRFLWPFLGRESTVARAAEELDCHPNAMLYRVRRMTDLGILRVVRVQPRSGRPVKIYRAVHDGYFVPTEVMHFDDVHHRVATHSKVLVKQLIDSYVGVLSNARRSGRVVARNDLGQIWGSDLMPLQNAQGRPAYFADATVHLTLDEAREVQQLLDRAQRRSTAAARESPVDPARTKPYLFMGCILPR